MCTFVVVVVVVFVLTSTRIIKSVVTGQAPVTLELRNIPRKNTHNPRWYTHISQLTQFMPPPETYKSEIGIQSTMCQVGPDRCIRLTTHAWRNQIFRLPPKEDYHVYITRIVVSFTTHTHDRHKSIGEKETKKRKKDKGKERREKKKRNKTKGKQREEKDKKSKKRQDRKARKEEKKRKKK